MATPTPPPTVQSPALWNPNAAACWSLLFTPAFGAYLHARNADALGRGDEAKANRVWFNISIGYLLFAMASTFVPTLPDAALRLGGLVLLLGWYFSLGQDQVVYVKATWHDDYARKSWNKPLLIAFGCLLGLFVILFILTLIQETFFGSA